MTSLARKARFTIITLGILVANLHISAQQINYEETIRLPEEHYTITQLFEILITEYNINLSYESKLSGMETTLNFPKPVYTLESVMDVVENESKTIELIIRNNNIIARQRKLPQKFTISGFVKSKTDGEALIGANVYEPESLAGTVANEYGFFSLNLPGNKANIRFSYIGYQTVALQCSLASDTIVNIYLSPAQEIDEVIVKANEDENLESTQVSKSTLELKKTELLPKLAGESDLLKSIQLLPGVQSGTEGTGALYVRGGGQGNNLVLLDGATVYNSNHLWGLFSVFNTEALQHIELYKGGFPARYGGRLSSVLNVRMKEGNTQKFSGSGSIGLISSKILLEGPVIKGKTSFLVTGRRSNLDLLAAPFVEESSILSELYFYDVNAKINHAFSSRNRIFLSMYKSYDNVGMSLDESFFGDEQNESFYTYYMKWGNTTSTLRWNSVLSNSLFLSVTATYSSYDTKGQGVFKGVINEDLQEKTNKYISNLEAKTGGFDLSWYPNNRHSVKFGADFLNKSYPYIKEKKLVENGILFDDQIQFDTVFNTTEIRAYLQDEITLLPNLTTQLGLHVSYYTIANENFRSMEPRFSLRYEISPDWSVKTAYTEMTQNDFQSPSVFKGYRTKHAVSFSLNPEIWLPCTRILLPQKSKQVVLGTYLKLGENYELSVEGFYTSMDNMVEDSRLVVDEIPSVWEDLFRSGKGRSYGSEFMLKKEEGKLSGWIAYTLSKSERQFDAINNGNYFPYLFDRTHNATVVMNYSKSKKFDIGIIWDFKSGRHLTLPDGQYASVFNLNNPNIANPENDLYALSEVNAYRLPPYHRLDIGFNFHKERKRYNRTFSVGVYNVYNKHNTFLTFFDFREAQSNTDIKQEVIKSMAFIRFLPYFNYSIKF